MFHNIIVCVDGSVHAERALDEAIDLAEAGHGRLTILTAIPRPPSWAASPAGLAAMEPLAEGLTREFKQVLSAAAERVPQTVPVTTILSEEPIRDALMHRLHTGEHDLLVMGSRGRGMLSSSLLGSVSHYALNHSTVPVLIIHSPDEDARESEQDHGVAESVQAPQVAVAAGGPAG